MVDFKERERLRQKNKLHLPIFDGAETDGIFNGERHDYVLRFEDTPKNLYAPIRQDALDYFDRYDISWWHQREDRCFPTGHLLSSQIHCLNHLFALRKDHDAVLSMIRPIGERVGVRFDKVLASPIDTKEAYFDESTRKKVSNSNYITFEFVCHNMEMLDETHETRGKNCTSVDAFIYARAGRENWLIPIEWKYTETYDPTKPDAYNFGRYSRFVDQRSRIKEWSGLYRKEPFYEFGRQTLLMERLIAEHPLVGKVSKSYPQKPLGADKFLHLIVVPEENKVLREDVMRFLASLKDDMRAYCQLLSPETLLAPLAGNEQFDSLMSYLKARYWC